MPIDLTGITNENEFYSRHYLTAILDNDLKHLFRQWRRREEEEHRRPPPAALRTLSTGYFAMRTQLEKERRPHARLRAQRDFLARSLSVLGYEFSLQTRELDDGSLLPIIGEVVRPNGTPELWVLEGFDPGAEETDPLTLGIDACQYRNDVPAGAGIPEASLDEVVTRQVFGRAEPPRWVLLASDSQLLLLDRTKWNRKRLLRFELSEIFGRREVTTFQAVAALLHRDSVCPAGGISLLDTLDENSHKHAFAVSEDLTYALREAIELIGNEAVHYLRETRREEVFGRDLADQLTVECLRYMFRLLFLFSIEARPELGYAPMNADAYRTGYSLETLRDLEQVTLTTEHARSGYYIHDSLSLLFELVYNGYPRGDIARQEAFQNAGRPQRQTSRIPPLRGHLFDPSRTPLLNRVRFRNAVLQRVIELMSLTRPKRGRHRRGRISYAQLGINQLGAVYEALLSYRGFFAETDLYEVTKAKERHDELATAYVVTAEDLEKYTEEERVRNEDGTARMYPRGTFIYRLAGRDRETSASYYTPEVLTRCLVTYALKELLKDTCADEILELTICEPAMGSAAFLNEAINQLSDAYLERKQRETGIAILHEDYARQKQKVKMRLAGNNVFGVDLNPTAVELGEVSLWLNTIYGGASVPWFGMRLVTGNSLIGARKQVYDTKLLRPRFKKAASWLDEVPERVRPGETRPEHTVYHFLLPDRGMAAYKDVVVKQMASSEMTAIDRWRRGFTKPFTRSEIEQLERLSDAVEILWARHVERQRRIRSRTSDHIHVFGQGEPEESRGPPSIEEKDRILRQEILGRTVRNSSPYHRLKLVMDYWCALWFWPIEKAELLPAREEFLLDLELILQGNDLRRTPSAPQAPQTNRAEKEKKPIYAPGSVDVEALCRELPRLGVVQELAQRYRFLHWELQFADVFEDRGGFDLVLGNPPWIKVTWNEGGVMGDAEPLFVLRKLSASALAALRETAIDRLDLRSRYLSAYEEAEATRAFLGGYQNYPMLRAIQANVYKCFLPQAWLVGRHDGVSAFVHPEGVYDDPRGGRFRREIYRRLRSHFQFQNELLLFSGVDHHTKFSINVYRSRPSDDVGFDSIANLYSPATVDACYSGGEQGEVGGLKNHEGAWNRAGHDRRIVRVGHDELALFAMLYDPPGRSALEARLPALHAQPLVEVLRKFASQPNRLADLKGEYVSTVMFDETYAQRDGTIRRDTRFPSDAARVILSGPHFFVGNPFYKTPNAGCSHNQDYSVLDLTALPDDYLPRTNYVPACDPAEYLRRTPRVPWGKRREVTAFYRLAFRGMLSQSGERTLTPAIIPPGAGHTNAAQTTAFKHAGTLLAVASFANSIIADFFIKTTGRANLHYTWESFPLVEARPPLRVRTLLLNCITNHYADLWRECFQPDDRTDRWAKHDPRLDNAAFADLTSTWNRTCALRTDYARRQAIVEIDVLAAMALRLTPDELKTIYRIQFPVLRRYEQDTWYDRTGRIVFTANKGLTGAGVDRTRWEAIRAMKSGTVERTVTDDTLPGGPRQRTVIYHAPFDRCDREEDYDVAWAEFHRRFGGGKMS